MRGLPVGGGGGLLAGRRLSRPGMWRACAATCAMLAVLVPAATAAAAPGAPPQMHGRSAAVLDERDGALLWADNGHLRLPMASTTKMMTALVACQLLDDRVDTPMVIPPDVKQAYGELLYLRPGDRYTFLQLLEGMLLPSANDAAIAVAVNAAGSQQRFVEAMNEQAYSLGLNDTHFANPDGLEDPDHYSSAVDLAKLGAAAMRDPVIQSIVRMPNATIPWPDHGSTRVIGNINALLAYFPGATGIKTGYTSQAQNVIVGSASRGGESVVAVVMGEPAATLWHDEEHLLQYGLDLAAMQATGPGGGSAGSIPQPAGPARVGPALVAPDLMQGMDVPAASTGSAGHVTAGGAARISSVVLPAIPPPAPGPGAPPERPASAPMAAEGAPVPGALRVHPREVAFGGILALAALGTGLLWRRGVTAERLRWRVRTRRPETWMAP